MAGRIKGGAPKVERREGEEDAVQLSSSKSFSSSSNEGSSTAKSKAPAASAVERFRSQVRAGV